MTVQITETYEQVITEPTEFMINTGKAFKGHKLTLKDTLRRMNMKSRHSVKRTNPRQDKKQKSPIQFTQYTEKYKALDTIDDQADILRYIIYQRVKHSKENIRSMKLFSRSQHRPPTSSQQSSHHCYSARPSKTSQTNRSTMTTHTTTKTIEYNTSNSQKFQNHHRHPIKFKSSNLSPLMNEYLNLLIDKKQREGVIIGDQQMIGNINEMKKKEIQRSSVLSKSGHKKNAGNFFRKMKKQQQESNSHHSITPQKFTGSQELVKNLKKMVLHNSVFLETPKSKQNYSKEDRKALYMQVRATPKDINRFTMKESFKNSFNHSTLASSPNGVASLNSTARK